MPSANPSNVPALLAGRLNGDWHVVVICPHRGLQFGAGHAPGTGAQILWRPRCCS